MPGKPKTFYKRMSFNDAIKEYPLYSKDIEAERAFISLSFNDGQEAYCLHCEQKISLDNVKFEILLFTKSGFPVPDDDERYCYEPRVLASCPTEGCEGNIVDWKGSPWN